MEQEDDMEVPDRDQIHRLDLTLSTILNGMGVV